MSNPAFTISRFYEGEFSSADFFLRPINPGSSAFRLCANTDFCDPERLLDLNVDAELKPKAS